MALALRQLNPIDKKGPWSFCLFGFFCFFLTALFTCNRASSTVQVVGKFWSLHNPQKLCMSQISFKTIYLIFRKIIYVNTNMVGSVTVYGSLHLKIKFWIWTITCIEYFLSVFLVSLKYLKTYGNGLNLSIIHFWLITHVFQLCLYMHMLLPLKVGVCCIYAYSLFVWDSRDIRGLYFSNLFSEKYILVKV